MTTAAPAETVALAFPPTGIVMMGMPVIAGELDTSLASLVADAVTVVPMGSTRVDSPVLELFVPALELVSTVMELTVSVLELAVAETSIVAPARTMVVEVKVLVSVV